MRIAIISFFLFHLLIVNVDILAQSYDLKFNLIKGPLGEPLGIIRGITQDQHGYMWFAAQGGRCLYKYDGVNIVVYKHDDSNPNSLTSGNLQSVYADKRGIIWIGMSTGLDRFEPSTGIFTHIKNDPTDSTGLKGGGPWEIMGDSKGRIWFCAGDLGQIDDKTAKIKWYHHDSPAQRSLTHNDIMHIYEDKNGTIWCGAGQYPWGSSNLAIGGLYRLEDNGTFTRFMHNTNDPQSLINNKVRAIYEDSRGIFWVGTGGDGLHTMDRKTGKFERHLIDPKDPEKLSRPAFFGGDFERRNDQVTFVQEDCVGKIWIGSMWGGINRFDPETNRVTNLRNSHGFPDRMAWSIFESRDRVLWISSVGDSLYRVDPFYKPIEHVKTGFAVQKFYEDKINGDLWLATEGDGLVRLNKDMEVIEKFKHDFSNPNSLDHRDNVVFNFPFADQNSIWLSTPAGLGIFNKSTKKIERLKINGKVDSIFIKRPIVNVAVDRDSIFWMTTWGDGLLRYNPKTSSVKQFRFSSADTLSVSSDFLLSVKEDKNGNIWISGSNALNKVNKQNESFIRYLKGSATQLFIDSRGDIYSIASTGLFLYNSSKDEFEHYFDAKSNLLLNGFQGMFEDDEHNFWLNSSDGSSIVRIDTKTKEPYVFDQRFGIKQGSLTRPIYKLKSGKIVVGSLNGFYSFLPNELKPLPNNLKILITDFQVNGKPTIGSKEIHLTVPIESAENINLRYNENNLAFSFAAVDYRNPEATHYYTRLDGYDTTWIEAKREKKIDYFNLPKGEYIFKIRVYLFDGTSGERMLRIFIHPPWWQTWWAYSSYVVFFGISIWSTSKYRSRSLKKQNVLLEEKVTMRTEALNNSLQELKATQSQLIHAEKMASLGELTAGIAHEIQNPLNFVNNFSEASVELIDTMHGKLAEGNLEPVTVISNKLKNNLNKIIHHGKRADSIVKGMLLHSRQSSGQKEPTNINAICDEYMRLSYHGLRAKDKTFNAEFKMDFDSSLPKINIISQDFSRVILNLINNAFYAVNEKLKSGIENYQPNVTISTKRSDNKVLISIKDNGNGIPENIRAKIFQPFFTTKPTGEGTGLGLSLSYDIIRAHNGEIRVESQLGAGTEFIISIPI